MSAQLDELREDINKAWNDDGPNKNYYVGQARDKLKELDEYVSMLEKSVAVMSATLNKGK